MSQPEWLIASALASADDQPWATYRALAGFANALVGARLFTLMAFDETDGCAVRFFSNMPEAYPVSGRKPANPTDWSRQVLQEHRTFVANDIAAIAQVFPDHELIRSLGCESVLNVPIVIAGKAVGSINCLDKAGNYTPERVAASEALKLPGAACFLFHMQFFDEGGQ